MSKFLSTWIQRRFRPEDPQRIRLFKTRIDGLAWDSSCVVDSMSVLFDAVDDLAQSEVRYYFRRRGTRAWVSGVTRFLAWLFGSFGLLIPLLASGEPTLFNKEWGSYGYACLAAAASFLAANSLFGGTDGHIRFVATQLDLEKLITTARVRWCM